MPFEWDIEEIILDMADLVIELRKLRRENAELREFKDKYYEEVNQRFKDSQQHSANMLKLALAIGDERKAELNK